MCIHQPCDGPHRRLKDDVVQLNSSRSHSAIDQQRATVCEYYRNISSIAGKQEQTVAERNRRQRAIVELFRRLLDHSLARSHLCRDGQGRSCCYQDQDNELNKHECEAYFLKTAFHSVLLST